jgi:hypothetical protein
LNLSAGGALYLVNLYAVRRRLTIFRANFTGCLADNGSAVYVEGFDIVFHCTHFDACTTGGSVIFVNSTDVAGVTMEVPFVSFNDTDIGIRQFWLIYAPYATYGHNRDNTGRVYLPLATGATNRQYFSPPLPIETGYATMEDLSYVGHSYEIAWPHDPALDGVPPPRTPVASGTPGATVPTATANDATVVVTTQPSSGPAVRPWVVAVIVIASLLVLSVLIAVTVLCFVRRSNALPPSPARGRPSSPEKKVTIF